MTEEHSLFNIVTLGKTTLKNRIGLAPMTRISATADGLVTDDMLSYYSSFARGGFGLVITEGNFIDGQYSKTYVDQPGMISEQHVQAWKKVVDAVHQEGAKIIMQLQHSGFLSQANSQNKGTLGPSAIQPKGEQLEMYLGDGPFLTPKEATMEDLKDVIHSFAKTALRAKEAGFDGVEIHGANGYLLDGFLTDYANQRKDEYGGSTENRVRLSVEVAGAIREAVGQDFIVGIRISQAKVNDYAHKWAGKEQDAKVIFGKLGQAGLDYIHVTEYQAWEPAFDSNGPSLAALAKQYGGIPVIANGHLEDPEKAKDMIKNGEADVVTLGKGALANHDWANKVKNNELIDAFDAKMILTPNAKLKDVEVK